MKESPYFYTDRFSEYDETLKQNHDEYMTAMTKKNDYLSQHFSKKTIVILNLNFILRFLKQFVLTFTHFQNMIWVNMTLGVRI